MCRIALTSSCIVPVDVLRSDELLNHLVAMLPGSFGPTSPLYSVVNKAYNCEPWTKSVVYPLIGPPKPCIVPHRSPNLDLVRSSYGKRIRAGDERRKASRLRRKYLYIRDYIGIMEKEMETAI